jgi:hypothetical protein
MSATASETDLIETDLIEIAECLVAADKRLRALESNPSARHSDVNRIEAQVATMRKELDFATIRVNEAGKREFSAKAEANAESYRTDLARLRTELEANIRGFKPVGEWKAGMVLNRMDVVSLGGSSYLVLANGVTEKPKTKSDKFQLLARRGGGGAGGGGIIVESSFTTPPASASATGSTGQWSFDSSYFYLCVAANTWLRTSLATW